MYCDSLFFLVATATSEILPSCHTLPLLVPLPIWAAPVQRPVGSGGSGPEQVGADRLREDGIVYRQRDVVAGLFADALPAGADLGPVLLTDVNTEVGRVLGVRRLGWNEGQFGISAQGPNEAGIAKSAEHTPELQSLMRHSYAAFCLKKILPPP